MGSHGTVAAASDETRSSCPTVKLLGVLMSLAEMSEVVLLMCSELWLVALLVQNCSSLFSRVEVQRKQDHPAMMGHGF